MLTAEEQKKKALCEELEHLEFQIKTAREEFTFISELKRSVVKELDESISQLTLQRDDLSEEVEFLMTQNQPFIEKLKAWEKSLRTRERDISVVIERYKRLYAEHGAGFKI